jgi:hypothetical protein
MWSPSRKKENDDKNDPVVNCTSYKSRGTFSDHLRCILLWKMRKDQNKTIFIVITFTY